MRKGLVPMLSTALMTSGCATKGDMIQFALFDSMLECERAVNAAASRLEGSRSYAFDAKPNCKKNKDSHYEGSIRTGTNFGPGPDYLGKTDDIRIRISPEQMAAEWLSKNVTPEPVDAQPQMKGK